MRLKPALEGGRPIRDEPLDPDEEKAHPRLPVPHPEAGARAAQRRRGRPRRRAGRWSSGSRAGYAHRHALVDALSAQDRDGAGRARRPTRRPCSWRSSASPSRRLDRVIALSYRLVGLISFLTAGPRRGPRLADPRRLERRRRRGRDPHGPRARASSAPRRSRYEDLLALGLDRRGEEARQGPLGGQDLPRPRRGRRSRSCSAGRTEPGGRRARGARPEPAGATPSVEAVVAALRGRPGSRRSRGPTRGPSRSARKFSSSSLRDVDRGRQPIVRDRDELVVPLELVGDRLDEGLVLERVEDPAADRLDELEELLGLHLVLAGEQHVGEDVVSPSCSS